MKVLLAFPPVPPDLTLYEMRSRPPYGVYLLAGVLRSKAIPVQVIDPTQLECFLFEDDADRDRGLSECLDGVTVLGVSAHVFNWGTGLQLIRHARRLRPDLAIVLGGLHPTLFPDHTLEVSGADYVVRGEGEKAFPALLNLLGRGEDPAGRVPGVVGQGRHRRLPPQRLQPEEIGMASPAYDLVPRNYGSVSVESSRGCRNTCSFCSVPYRGSWRSLSPGVVVDRVARALETQSRPGSAREVFFVDDCFTSDPDRACEILRAVGKMGARAVFQGRVDDLAAPGVVESLPWEAIRTLQLGVEVGYDEGLRRIGKGITLEVVDRVLARIADTGTGQSVVASFIVGFPWEKPEDWSKTIHYAASLAYDYEIHVSTNVFGLFPSPLWGQRHRFGITEDEGVFDAPLWMLDADLYSRLHPNLTPANCQHIQGLIAAYDQTGVSPVNLR